MTALQTSQTTRPIGERPKISVQPGVVTPDWSAVTSPIVENALEALFRTCDWEKRWSGLSAAEDRMRRAILLGAYAATGHMPAVEDLASKLDIDQDETRDLIAKLKERDMVVLREGGTTLVGAYPFIERETEHRVRLGKNILHAMCAIDALGAGAMFGTDTSIESSCRHCATAIHVETRAQGTKLGVHTPAGAVVWLGIRYENGCAADSLCTVMAFFCSDNHLESWHAGQDPTAKGFHLSMDEALQAGQAIFKPLLAVPVSHS